MTNLRALISLAQRSPKRLRGQIATFLLLIVVVVLIFALVVMNLGRVGVTSTTVANATDSTTLTIASQLASRANQLCHAIGNDPKNNKEECKTEKCKKTGFLSTLVAIVIGAIITIASFGWGAWATPWIVGLISGGAAAAGGGITGAITGTGALTGALQGFAIGFTIGMGFGRGPLGYSTPASIANVTPVFAAPTAAGMTLASLGVASAVYGNYVQNQMISEGMVQASKALNGLPQYESMRESALLQALVQTVDDPNRSDGTCRWVDPNGNTFNVVVGGDPFDSDSDGDRKETISCFQYWWDRRIQLLSAGIGQSAEGVIKKYFRSGIPPYSTTPGLITGFRNSALAFLYELERSEVECDCQPKGTGFAPEGTPLVLWRRLSPTSSSSINFWQPGPNQGQLRGWYNQIENDPCTTCAPKRAPDGFDSVDAVRQHYETLVEYLKGVIWSPSIQGVEGLTESDWIKGLAATYNDWVPLLINPNADPATDGTIYKQFDVILSGGGGLQGIPEWISRTAAAREQLPDCKVAFGPFINTDTASVRPPYTPPNGPTCANSPPIYACTWKDASSGATGPHFRDATFAAPTDAEAGPRCKVYGAHKANLLAELKAVRDFIDLKNFKPYFIKTDLPDPLCPVGEQLADPPGVELTIQELCLDKEKDRGAKDDLSYTVDYKYSCGVCTPAPPRDCSGQQAAVTAAEKTLADAQAALTTCQNPPPPCGGCNAPCSTDANCCGSGTCIFVGVCAGTCSSPPPSPPPDCTAQSNAVAVANTNLANAQKDLTACQTAPPPPPICTSAAKTGTVTNVKLGIGARDIHLPCGSAAAFTSNLGAVDAAVAGILSPGNVFATVDADFKDEFSPVTSRLTDEIQNINAFRSLLDAFYAEITGLNNAIRKATDGRLPNPDQPVPGGWQNWALFGNPFNGRYAWEDTHGKHVVEVEMGPFRVASTTQRRYGNWLVGKTCLELIDYCDGMEAGDRKNRKECDTKCCYEPGRGRGDTFVQITRTDPSGPELGLFWRLNPFGISTRKTAKAQYHVERVGIDSIQ